MRRIGRAVCRDLASTRQALPFRNRVMVTPAL